jgi:hypothetical protein
MVLLEFTRPDGKPIWVVPSQVIMVTPAIDLPRGPYNARTQIRTSSGDVWVADEPAAVVKRLEDQ